jgi:hypothetical protein
MHWADLAFAGVGSALTEGRLSVLQFQDTLVMPRLSYQHPTVSLMRETAPAPLRITHDPFVTSGR